VFDEGSNTAGIPRRVLAVQLLALSGAVALAVERADLANWDLTLLGVLLLLGILSDLSGSNLEEREVKISGSFLTLVLAMVLLGGAPAALVGVTIILVGWLRWREPLVHFGANIAIYAWFPLLGGALFRELRDGWNLGPGDMSFYLLVFMVFMVALALNFVLVAVHLRMTEGISVGQSLRTIFVPVLPSELAAALLAVGATFLYEHSGIAVIALFGIVLVTFQYLLGALLVSQDRARQLEQRTEQLATAQADLLKALLRSLDLRDRMTARHSAAVARYAREIARAAGLPEERQRTVHRAALLHDIGKFVLPDRILKANERLSDEDWALIKTHPEEGAKVVAQVDGYEEIAAIILAHHERIDGRGYPRGLEGDDIPVLSRIISIADTYDVMTARDTYRDPVPADDAIAELRRVSGEQLDAYLVESFVRVLQGRDLRYLHGEDADFDAELERERRWTPELDAATVAGALEERRGSSPSPLSLPA